MRLGTDSIVPIVSAPDVDGFTPELAPDGGWRAYASNESGRLEVYLRPFPDFAKERHQVSAQGGRELNTNVQPK